MTNCIHIYMQSWTFISLACVTAPQTLLFGGGAESWTSRQRSLLTTPINRKTSLSNSSASILIELWRWVYRSQSSYPWLSISIDSSMAITTKRVAEVISPSFHLLLVWLDVSSNLYFFTYCYGAVGCIVWVFGSTAIWKLQQQVLPSKGEKVAMDFKLSMQNESRMVAIAVRSSLTTLPCSLNSWLWLSSGNNCRSDSHCAGLMDWLSCNSENQTQGSEEIIVDLVGGLRIS